MDLFFLTSKLLWVVANPSNLLLILLVTGVLLRWRVLTSLVLVCLLALAVYPLGNLLLQPLEKRFQAPQSLPVDIAGIIVLGGAEEAELSTIWEQPQFNMAAERDMHLLPLLQRYPDTPVIYTGGSSSVLKPEYRGADVLQEWLRAQGLADRVQIERNSRNTFENAVYSLDMLPDGITADAQEGWLLVTSAYHMPRSVGIFRKQGWNVIPYPVDYYSKPITLDNWRPKLGLNLFELGIAVREWLGLTAYYLTEKTDSWLPAEEHD